ncbi:hypothetical protein TSAR_012840, partial [Trichomalopsis sarcophagae]
ADYWKSQARKYCDFCKCWIADNKPSVEFHEGGKKHKENVAKRLKEIHRNSAKQAKAQQKFENEIEKMEKAAMAAYLKDVESDNRDMTADTIIHKKTESKQQEPFNPNRVPDAAPEAHPRFNESKHRQTAADVDPLDPYAKQKLARIAARDERAKKQAAKKAEEDQQQPQKDKSDKGKGKKPKDEPSGSGPPVRKVWYEARAQGCPYSYYWNIDTNESVWEPPMEGFMSLAEQAEELKEQALQEQLLQQIDQEEAKDKAELLEEQRANAEREKLKEIRKRFYANKKAESRDPNDEALEKSEDEGEEEEEEEEKTPYLRDYSVPDKPQPYGSWQVVRTVEKTKIDLQLPRAKVPSVPIITYTEPEPPQPSRVFKEKTITHVSTGDSDDEAPTVSFKKRKLGSKNMRRRMTDD